MHLYILGFMGSGKTTLFEKWRKDFSGPSFDFDHKLSSLFGVPPDELGQWIESNGWDKFRARECELLMKTLERGEGLYCLGGGAFSEQNIELFKKHPKARTVWLNTPVDICWDRVRGDTNRPLVREGKDKFFALYKQRESLYSQSKYLLSGDKVFPEWGEFWKNYVL